MRRRFNFVPARPSFLPASVTEEATPAAHASSGEHGQAAAATDSTSSSHECTAATSTGAPGGATAACSSSEAQPSAGGPSDRPAEQCPTTRGADSEGQAPTEAAEEGREGGEANDDGTEVEVEVQSEGEEDGEGDEGSAVWRPDFTTLLALGRGLLGEVAPAEGEASEGLSDQLAGLSLAKQLAASGFTKQNEADLHAVRGGKQQGMGG